MSWNHRLAIWITDLLCPRLGKARQPGQCPDFLEPDELREDDWNQWAEYINQPHVTENNRHYLDALWTKK
jgi:hypothetical protein